MSANLPRLIFASGFCLAESCLAAVIPLECPNVVILYADDLGIGDVSCYGATEISTPNIDRITAGGIRFDNAYSASATCTPSRYALLTGEYPWRMKDTEVLAGDDPLIIRPGRTTLASMFRTAGYRTGVVGKWHLGLGEGQVDWNHKIVPGPNEIGFDESFILPATGDRVPSVYVENGRVVGLDPSDPLVVSYQENFPGEPTGQNNPELLKMMWSHGHNDSIVNGISRMGYMKGGESARWVDEDLADVLTQRAIKFIRHNQDRPFFLYFASHDPHVPRVPHPRFAGKSGMGPRGDVILQLDWCIGQILDALDACGVSGQTIVIFSSDNGPILDDGYIDQAAELVGDHVPAGVFRGAKYSAFEAGARVPFILRYPGYTSCSQSDALVSQVDLAASFSAMLNVPIDDAAFPDSENVLPALLGRSEKGRQMLVTHSKTLALVTADGWKFIAPRLEPLPAWVINKKIEFGCSSLPQLYHLETDPGETKDLAASCPERVDFLASKLCAIKHSENK